MTLALLYANQDFVTIAADRRTVKDGKPQNDPFTKIAVIRNQFLFSFTGLAELGPDKHTIEWLVKTAAKFTANYDFGGIADEATKAVSLISASKELKRLAFAGVGYDEHGNITYVLISNMHSGEGQVLDEAQDKFMCVIDYPPRLGEVRCVGQQPPSEAGIKLVERLAKAHHTTSPSMNRVQKILAGAIAASAGKYISKTSMVVSLRNFGNGAQFDVITPGAKAGQIVDIASPYVLFSDQSIKVMPNQKLRRAKRGKKPKRR